jgi:hypothetical protein
VPIGGTACESQYEVPADTQGLQGLLRASGTAVTFCHCGLRQSKRPQGLHEDPGASEYGRITASTIGGSMLNDQVDQLRLSYHVISHRIAVSCTRKPLSSTRRRPKPPHHQPCTNACAQNVLPDTALLAAHAGKQINAGCGACVVTNLMWHLTDDTSLLI